MKKVVFKITAMMLFVFLSEGVFAQEYCIWIFNNRSETLNELRVRETGSSRFSEDLLPNNYIESGKGYWIRVSNWSGDRGDIQITSYDGTPLLFYVIDVNGVYRNYNYLTLDFYNLHTLVLNENKTFTRYNYDAMRLGPGCNW